MRLFNNLIFLVAFMLSAMDRELIQSLWILSACIWCNRYYNELD